MKTVLFYLALTAAPLRATSLDDAQTIAVENSPRLKTLRAEIAEAETRFESTSLMGRPILGVAGGAEFEAMEDGQDLLPLAYGYFSYNLYNGDQTKFRRTIASAEISRLKDLLPFEERDIRLQVKDVYLDVLYTRLRLKLLEKEKMSFDRLKKQASQRRNAGLIGDADVLEFDLRSTDLNAEIEALKAEEQTEIAQLSASIGQAVAPSNQALPEIRSMERPDSANSSISTASMKRLERDRDLGMLEANLRKAQWAPQVDFEARAGRLPSEGVIEKHKPRVDALIVAKWDLFTGGQQTALLKETTDQATAVATALDEEKYKIELRKTKVLNELSLLKRKSESQSRRKTPAQRYYQAMLEEYNRGIKNSPDVAHAAEAVFDIDQQVLALHYQWAKAATELERIIGPAVPIQSP